MHKRIFKTKVNEEKFNYISINSEVPQSNVFESLLHVLYVLHLQMALQRKNNIQSLLKNLSRNHNKQVADTINTNCKILKIIHR